MNDIRKALEGLRGKIEYSVNSVAGDCTKQDLANLQTLETEIARLRELVAQYQRAQDLDAEQKKKLVEQRDEARYYLQIYVHAHKNDNAIPPILEAKAESALSRKGERGADSEWYCDDCDKPQYGEAKYTNGDRAVCAECYEPLCSTCGGKGERRKRNHVTKSGTFKTVIPGGMESCPDCNGTGNQPKVCDDCSGRGTIWDGENLTGMYPPEPDKKSPCPTCNGTGKEGEK